MQDNIKAKVRAYIVDNFIMGGNADHLKDADSFMETHVVPENLDSLDNIDAYVQRKLAAA